MTKPTATINKRWITAVVTWNAMNPSSHNSARTTETARNIVALSRPPKRCLAHNNVCRNHLVHWPRDASGDMCEGKNKLGRTKPRGRFAPRAGLGAAPEYGPSSALSPHELQLGQKAFPQLCEITFIRLLRARHTVKIQSPLSVESWTPTKIMRAPSPTLMTVSAPNCATV